MPYKPPSETIKHLEQMSSVINQLINGLNGHPFTWGDTEGHYNTQRAQRVGCTLMTKTALKKEGYELKRNAHPVGRRYYPAPLSKYGELYIVECQCNDYGRWKRMLDTQKNDPAHA